MATMTTMQAQALQRVQAGISTTNYERITAGLWAKGIPLDDIKPRENVFTFHAWKALGRSVRKGEHGVKVQTWVERFDKDNPSKLIARFPKHTTVFHISQTDITGEPMDPAPTTNEPTPRPSRSSPADKLRSQCETIAAKIKDLEAPRRENTPKRAREGMSRRLDAANLERTRRAMIALAEAWDAGKCPENLQDLKTRSAIEPMVSKLADTSRGYYVVVESSKYRDDGPQAQALRQFVAEWTGDKHSAQDAEQAKRDRIRKMEDDIKFQKIDGFFPTPLSLIMQMIHRAKIESGMKILEPSAGKGDIAETIGGNVHCFELRPFLADIIKAKGISCECCDFLDMTPEPIYDRVLMNPPFEKLQDIEHVRAAFDWLKPGGRLVAIVSASFEFHQRAAWFRTWLEEVVAEVHSNAPDAFKDAFRSTSVQTRMLVIGR